MVDVRLLEDDAKFIRSLLAEFLKVTRLIFGVWIFGRTSGLRILEADLK